MAALTSRKLTLFVQAFPDWLPADTMSLSSLLDSTFGHICQRHGALYLHLFCYSTRVQHARVMANMKLVRPEKIGFLLLFTSGRKPGVRRLAILTWAVRHFSYFLANAVIVGQITIVSFDILSNSFIIIHPFAAIK